MTVHAIARKLFESGNGAYMPHLSLAYRPYPESSKIEVIHNLSGRLRTSFNLSDLFLIRADSNDPKDWHEISAFPLNGKTIAASEHTLVPALIREE